MKVVIILLVALSIWQCSSQNLGFEDIPEKQLKELEQALNFNKARANSQQMNAFKSGFFNQLFNQNQDPKQEEVQPEKKKMSQIIKELPYEVLLPRRRSSPLDLFGKLFNQKSRKNMVQIESQSDPLDELNQLIGQKQNKDQNVYWQNPDFKQGQKQIPFSRIFGQKSRTHRDLLIEKSLIERLLVQAMPNLKGGNILKLSSVPYQKGIYLHIEYSGEKGQLYTIKAKYRRKNNELQIISLSQITLSAKQDDSISQSYSQQIKDEPKKDQKLPKEVEQKNRSKLVETKQNSIQKEASLYEKKPEQQKKIEIQKEQLQTEKKQNLSKEPAKKQKKQKQLQTKDAKTQAKQTKDAKTQTKQSKEVKKEKKEVNEVKETAQAKSSNPSKNQQTTVKKQQASKLKKQTEEKGEKQAKKEAAKSIQSN